MKDEIKLLLYLIFLITLTMSSCKIRKKNLKDNPDMKISNFRAVVFEDNKPIMSMINPYRISISKNLHFKLLAQDDLFESISVAGYHKFYEPFTLKRYNQLDLDEFSFTCSEYFCNEFQVTDNLSITPYMINVAISMKGGKYYHFRVSLESNSASICN